MAFNSASKVTTLQATWRDDFGGAATTSPTINSNWEVTNSATGTTGAPTGATPTSATAGAATGMTVNINGSSGLSIATGTTASQTTFIQTAQSFSIPCRVSFFLTGSGTNRATNSDIYFELVNAAGDMFYSTYLTNGSGNQFNTASCNSNSVVVGTNTLLTGTTLNNGNQIWFEVFPDSIEMGTQSLININNAEAAHQTILQRIPDPQQQYFFRIRVVNGATAPTFSFTYTIDHVTFEDITAFHTKITGGRGSTAGSQAIPVYPTGTAFVSFNAIAQPVNLQNSGQAVVETNSLLGAGGTFVGPVRNTQTGTTLFIAAAYADQPGTLFVEFSVTTNTGEWWAVGSVALAAGEWKTIDTPTISNLNAYWRVRYVNGATAQTKFGVYSSFKTLR